MIYYSDKCLLHKPSNEFNGHNLRSYPEQPKRIEVILDYLKSENIEVSSPEIFDLSWISKVHAQEYVDFITSIPENLEEIAPTAFNFGGNITEQSSFLAKLGEYFFDPATPIMGNSDIAAKSAVDCSLSVAKTLQGGNQLSAALVRPPGHHAMAEKGGGYCIFNNIAIAANFLTEHNNSVSILDLDFHHGNGTQQIFYHRDDVQYVSIHADPSKHYPFYWGYPSEKGIDDGKGFTHNLSVGNTISEEEYLNILDEGIMKVTEYNPDIVLVSMGFDCHIKDPIAGMSLQSSSYKKIGEQLQSFERVGIILEGGYHIESIGDSFYNLYTGIMN